MSDENKKQEEKKQEKEKVKITPPKEELPKPSKPDIVNFSLDKPKLKKENDNEG